MKSKLLFLLLVAFIAIGSTYSQGIEKRPKVGLVLSGGGAKGFAHIGVLKVLEEEGIKVDYIGGTSMGAIVGGLYASGYTAHQIDSIFRKTNFSELLQDYVPREAKTYYGKRSDELYALTLPFDKFRLGIPRSYVQGLYNFNMMSRLTHSVRHIQDFNHLPIPFLCIATDIETGEEVVLNKGSLAMAIRASSALPSLFSPVEIDGRLLVDGGVTNNYPIDEIRQLGADIIIGVDVQDALKSRENLNDATKILSQISSIGQAELMRRKKRSTDIYIKPDISDYNVISFSEGSEIIKKGEIATREKLNLLKQKLGVHEKDQRSPLKIENDSLCVRSIHITGLKDYTRSYVMGKLGFKHFTTLSYDQLRMGINNLSATQNFSSISYSFEELDGEDLFKLSLIENPTRAWLRFGLHYDGLFKSGILTNLTYRKLFFKNDVISADMVLGDNVRYTLDYYVDNGYYFSYGFRSKMTRFKDNILSDFSNGRILDNLGLKSLEISYLDLSQQLYVQTIFMQKFVLGVGAELKHLKLRSETIANGPKTFERSDYFSLYSYLKYDSYDNKYFPRSGWGASGDLQTYLFSSDFSHQFTQHSIVKGEIGIARPLFKRATLKLDAEAGGVIGNGSVSYFNFHLGGYGFQPFNNIRSFHGYDFLGISGNSYVKAGANLDYEFARKHHLSFSANYAQVENGLFRTADWISAPKYSGYAVGYGLESLIGPIEIKYTWSPELPKGYFMFNVGYAF